MYWKAKPEDTEAQISIERRDEILREFAELSPQGSVVLCGGEKLLDPDRYFAATARCAQSGLRCIATSNGTTISSTRMADRMVEQGPNEITVSLNSHRREVHDRSRGVTGSFDAAVGALRRLLASRAQHGRGPKIFAMAVVCTWNYRELDPFYDFVLNDIGADKLKLNFLQPTFGPPTWWFLDSYFAKNVIRDEEELARIIRACDEKYHLRINPLWLEQVKMYHRSVRKNGWAWLGWRLGGQTEEHICNSYERNIMVDLRGRARLCFNPVFPACQLSAPGDLRRFWEGSGELREKMRRCNRYCAISHSVRRESATLRA
jgi:MoaA/NifB/PqqE/SkfB family radical SAM enzyme